LLYVIISPSGASFLPPEESGEKGGFEHHSVVPTENAAC